MVGKKNTHTTKRGKAAAKKAAKKMGKVKSKKEEVLMKARMPGKDIILAAEAKDITKSRYRKR